MGKTMTPAMLQRANERRRKSDRNRKIFELWKQGVTSYADISRALVQHGYEEITPKRVSAIVKRELQRVSGERKEIALDIFDGELERLTMIVRNSWAIAMQPCRECRGAGAYQNGETCGLCDGEGKANAPDIRLKAMKQVQSAIDQRAKMLGLYAPEKFAMTDRDGNDVSYMEELRSLSGDDLDTALSDFAAGVAAAEQLAEERTTKVEGVRKT